MCKAGPSISSKLSRVYAILGYALGIGLVILALFFIDKREQDIANAYRCHIFEDLLKPGMTRSEVREILEQFGSFDEHERYISVEYYSVAIDYKDPQVKRQLGEFYLLFRNNRFDGAWLPYGVGESAPVCKK